MTGGTGYLGMKVVGELQAVGRDVRVIDVILHGQDDLAAEQRDSGVDLLPHMTEDQLDRVCEAVSAALAAPAGR